MKAKRSFVIHNLAALTVFLVWVAAIVAMVVNREFWAEALPYILTVSAASMAGTVLLCRYWIKRNSVPSYGSILSVPLVCAFLLYFGGFFLEACRYNEWYLFTLGYWEQAKGGFAGLIFPFVIVWLVCLFPAAAIVIYFQKPNGSK